MAVLSDECEPVSVWRSYGENTCYIIERLLSCRNRTGTPSQERDFECRM